MLLNITDLKKWLGYERTADVVAWLDRMKTQRIDLIGAPERIRTSDRLVRSPAYYSSISTTCGGLFWPRWPVIAEFIKCLARFFDREMVS